MKNLSLLKPKVQELAERLIAECEKQGIAIAITSTFRTRAEQDALYAQGRTTPGAIVTNARSGFSLHNYGVAFDCVPLVNGKPDWDNIKAFDAVGKIGVGLGLEWGGNWKFLDKPHFQYTAGYTLEDFQSGIIDERRFERGQTPLLRRIVELATILLSLLKKRI